MTMNISVPPFSVAAFLHLNQIKGPICDGQGLVFPLQENIKMHIHTYTHTQNTSSKSGKRRVQFEVSDLFKFKTVYRK